jgi:hypothetical protein
MKKLSIKQRKFWKAYSKTGNLAEGARAAGSKAKDSHSLSQVGYQMLKSIELSIDELLELKGLSDNKLLKVLEDGLNATKVISCNVMMKGHSDEGGDKMKDADSMTKDFIDVDDYPTRHKYLETALKLKGHMKDKVELGGKDGGPINLVVNFVGNDGR